MSDSVLHNPNYALHHRLIDDDVRHITPEEASFAWSNQMFRRPRPRTDPLQIAALGHDSHGTMIEMVAYDAGAYADRNGNPLRVLYHANYVTTRFLKEFGLA